MISAQFKTTYLPPPTLKFTLVQSTFDYNINVSIFLSILGQSIFIVLGLRGS